MFSGTPRPATRSAAWRISMWGTLVFAIGSLVLFVFLHRFVSKDIQRRNDAWLWGELSLLGEMAERAPKGQSYGRMMDEIAEFARNQAPSKDGAMGPAKDQVFYLQEGEDHSLRLWVGAGSGEAALNSIRRGGFQPDRASDVHMDGFSIPFRVVSLRIEDGSRIYVGLSEEEQFHIMELLQVYFLIFWVAIVILGFGLVFSIARNLLNHVRQITDAASRIGSFDLTTRVPTTDRNDEAAQLALTLNSMLDRIENAMRQLHTMTDSLAHDLRSPITTVRGRLEAALNAGSPEHRTDAIVSSIEALDRLNDFLTESLDVGEAEAGALRLSLSDVNLEEALVSMIDLYRPSLADKNSTVEFERRGPAMVRADAALIHRMISNLFDNELVHLPDGSTIRVDLHVSETVNLTVEDDGPGFSPEVLHNPFERHRKGNRSEGRGLGLAFVEAVVRAHGGSVSARNSRSGGAQIRIDLPALAQSCSAVESPSLSC